MRVLIATGLYPPDIGGPATYTKFLERHLPRYRIEPVVVSFTHVRRYPKIIRHIVYLFRLLLGGRGVDIIYALDTVSVGVPALVASRMLRKKLYLRVPGDYAWEQGQQRFNIRENLNDYLKNNKRPLPVRMLAWLQSCVARSATQVVVPSDYMRGVVSAWGVDSERIKRIYSTLNPVAVTTTKEELRTKFSYRGCVVISSARLVPWKGMEVLIDAVVLLKDEGTDIMLEIIGDGTLRQHLDKHINALGAESYIHCRGKIDKGKLAERVKASDVFVLNTSYEGLSHQLLEVMDMGIPIITTPVGGNVELVTHNHEGLMVSYNNRDEIVDAIRTLHTDTALVARITKTAREKVKDFREDAIIPEIVKLFQASES